ncbi:MAG: RNA 3'-terminal phosphate cyclase [Candidatus Caldarchaeum sp.]|nr:RNA 3'-terminal phosphate cyclase [Candidatus Caldarchaeum sp.]MDW8435747.1 RNA 3'-terminal phosphate cyclase [Candidatus Caldarchaeum sp.]
MLELDGSIGEGGGQVLRVALAISAVTSKPLKIYNIRKKRSNPGLRHQHLTAVKAVQEACGGEVRGAFVGSSEILFIPGKISNTSVDLDTGTAGSTTLVLQSRRPVLCFGRDKAFFRITGGTNNPNAPTFEYFERVFISFLRKIGVDAQINLKRRGFYPRGGGTVDGYVSPVISLPSFDFTAPPNFIKASIHAYTSRLPSHVAERMTKACSQVLLENGISPVDAYKEVLTESDPRCAVDPGAGIFVLGSCEPLPIGVDALGERGVPAEKVGRDAAEAFLNELRRKEPVDSHLGDMMVIYAALARGVSRYRVTNLTNHTVTSIEVCKALLGIRANIEGRLGDKALITVDGCGFVNNNIQG